MLRVRERRLSGMVRRAAQAGDWHANARASGQALFELNEPYVRLALSGHAQRFERRLVKADGSQGYTDARYVPDRDGRERAGFFVPYPISRNSAGPMRGCGNCATVSIERSREDRCRSVAHTLHEGVAQNLFAAALTLSQWDARLEHSEVGAKAASLELAAIIEKCLVDIRQVANDLHPSASDNIRRY